MKILMAGCGDLGKRTALMLAPEHTCFGLNRRPSQLPSPIVSISADVTNVLDMKRVLEEPFDVIIVTVTPSAFCQSAYRESYVAAAEALKSAVSLANHPPKLLIWTSSTRVYGDHGGAWGNEDSCPFDQDFAGKSLLEAELLISQLSCRYVVVRFSGIYGPGRKSFLNKMRSGDVRIQFPEKWTNRIHSDDCAAVFSHLIKRYFGGESLDPLYIASDCEPVTQKVVYEWLAKELGVDFQRPQGSVAKEYKISRRCNNDRLLKSGFCFNYPTFRDGYRALIRET